MDPKDWNKGGYIAYELAADGSTPASATMYNSNGLVLMFEVTECRPGDGHLTLKLKPSPEKQREGLAPQLTVKSDAPRGQRNEDNFDFRLVRA